MASAAAGDSSPNALRIRQRGQRPSGASAGRSVPQFGQRFSLGIIESFPGSGVRALPLSGSAAKPYRQGEIFFDGSCTQSREQVADLVFDLCRVGDRGGDHLADQVVVRACGGGGRPPERPRPSCPAGGRVWRAVPARGPSVRAIFRTSKTAPRPERSYSSRNLARTPSSSARAQSRSKSRSAVRSCAGSRR